MHVKEHQKSCACPYVTNSEFVSLQNSLVKKERKQLDPHPPTFNTLSHITKHQLLNWEREREKWNKLNLALETVCYLAIPTREEHHRQQKCERNYLYSLSISSQQTIHVHRIKLERKVAFTEIFVTK